MIITTTPPVEGRPAREYLGIVMDEAISGVTSAGTAVRLG